MERRGWLNACALVAASIVALSTAFAAESQPASHRTNIMIVLADDLGWWSLGCYGNRDVRTPIIDRVATEGMKMKQAFVCCAICTPTRAELYTGLFPARNGLAANGDVHPRAGVRSIGHNLTELGYRVGIHGKNDPVTKNTVPVLGSEAAIKRFIDDASSPFCVIYASTYPHVPWTEKTDYDPARLTMPPMLIDNPETRAALATYYGDVSRFDDQVGRCLQLLEDTGKAKDTLLLVLTEHGSSFPGGKWTCYDDGVNVGMLARWPEHIRPGSESEAIVQYADVMPTLIALGGGDPAGADSGVPDAPDGGRGLDGRSFLDVLLGKAREHRDYAYSLWGEPEKPCARGIRDQRWKYIVNLRSNNMNSLATVHPYAASWFRDAKTNPQAAALLKRIVNRPPEELYDTLADPHELNNLAKAPENRERMKAMKQQLQKWMAQQHDAADALH
jgi:arylsulfatase A-like enzyme